MPEIESQLREYFEASVEGVTAEDVVARRIATGLDSEPPRRSWRPAWVAAAAFGATIVVLGGSLALGAAMRRPRADVGGWVPDPLSDTVAITSGAWLLIPAVAAIIAAVAVLIVRNQHATRKETVMATRMEARPDEHIETVRRSNRGLTVTIVVLALALVALGAWVMFDTASEPATAAPDEVNELINTYIAAWEEGNAEAFLEATTDDYSFRSFDVVYDQAREAAIVGSLSGYDFELVADLVVMGEGPTYYVTDALHVTHGGTEYVGVDAYRVVDTADGLKVAEHTWVGNR